MTPKFICDIIGTVLINGTLVCLKRDQGKRDTQTIKGQKYLKLGEVTANGKKAG